MKLNNNNKFFQILSAWNADILLEFLLIGSLVLGLITFLFNGHGFNYFTGLVLSFLFKSLLFGSFILLLVLIYKVIIQYIKYYKNDFLKNLKKEFKSIFPLRITKITFFFSVISFLFSFVLVYFAIFRLTSLFFFLGIFFLFKETTFVKYWLIDMKHQDLKINEKFRQKFPHIYQVTKLCKVFCFLYLIYFCIFCLNFKFLLGINSVEPMRDEFIKLFEPLYTLFLVFINSVIIDLFLEFVAIFFDADLVLTISNIARRTSRALVIGVGGGGGAAISVSPLVELPGVNESQILFGRGYDYKTPLDWTKGTVLNSYFDKSTVQGLAKKYAEKDILDGNSYSNMMRNEPEVRNHLNGTATPFEQRLMGLRKF
jgi:hypothetical protein